MFEPVQRLMDKHAVNFANILTDMRCHLADLVANTASKIENMEFGDFAGTDNTEGGTTAEVILQTREGYYWKVMQTAVTGGAEGACAVYLGNIAPESLIDVISPAGIAKSTANYYVPPRSRLIFHFYNQPNKTNCTAHVQVERFVHLADFTERGTISHEVSEIDKALQDPGRHRVSRTRKPDPEELRQSIRTP